MFNWLVLTILTLLRAARCVRRPLSSGASGSSKDDYVCHRIGQGVSMKSIIVSGGWALALLAASPAFAQRTDDNAVTEADDAFGKSVGNEQIGIYNPFDVRGFSPVSAGNVRVEGLYFDQQSNIGSRIIDGSTVHVGISAQGYPFPAPTGIADFDLRKPGDKFVASVGLNYGPFNGVGFEIDTQVPIDGARLGLIAGFGISRERNVGGTTPQFESYGLSIVWKPTPDISVQPFTSRITIRDEESQPLIFTSGDFLPPRIKRSKFFGQEWADFDGAVSNHGLVAKAKAGGFDLGLGIFRSELDVKRDHTDLLFDTDQTGRVGSRIVVTDEDGGRGSTSGEFKASRNFDEGPRRHTLHGSIRARELKRSYGGSAVIDLGPSRIGVEDFRVRPATVYGEKTRDTIRQATLGLGYELRWRDRGELSLGLQKTDYRKRTVTPAGPLPVSEDNPWLYSATAAVYLADNVALYGGYVRGLEESDVAPSDAVNRNEAPPAIRTEQKDFGVRWGISKGVSLVVGYFDVEKPYFNLDAARQFRQLGAVRNRGLEGSLSGQVAPGLFVVSGLLYLDSDVSGEEVRLGLIGPKPAGTFKLRTITNVNWQFPWHKPLTLTGRLETASDRVANIANSFEIPARSVTSIGARYRLDIGKTPLLIRGTVDNVFDKFGYIAGRSGFFVTNGPRRYSLSLAADL